MYVILLAVLGCLLQCAACLGFTWSLRWALVMSVAAGMASAVAAALLPSSQAPFWPSFFLAASAALSLAAWGILAFKLMRWVHRFVIYGGYAAVFGGMGLTVRVLQGRQAGAATQLAGLGLVYLIGSGAIFLVKAWTLRRAKTAFPGYDPAAGRDLW